MIPSTPTVTTVLIAVLLVGAVATPAAAATDDGDDEEGVIDQIGDYVNSATEAVSGALDRLSYAVLGGSEDAQTASDTADALDAFADDHGPAVVEYVNAYAPENASKTDYDVVTLHLTAGGESRTVYATAVVEDDEVQSVDVVNETDRDVDLTLTLDEFATRELPSDLEHVREHYIEAGQEPSSLRSYVASKYWTGDFGSDGGHVQIEGGDA